MGGPTKASPRPHLVGENRRSPKSDPVICVSRMTPATLARAIGEVVFAPQVAADFSSMDKYR